jgi:hypothetical protein
MYITVNNPIKARDRIRFVFRFPLVEIADKSTPIEKVKRAVKINPRFHIVLKSQNFTASSIHNKLNGKARRGRYLFPVRLVFS